MFPRVEKLAAMMREAGMTHMLVTKPKNMRYLTGYTGEGSMLIHNGQATLLTDFRYVEMAGIQAPGIDVVKCDSTHPLNGVVKAILAAEDGHALAIEEDRVTVAEHKKLAEALTGVALVPANGLIEKLRIVKDADELACIRKACAISCQAFEKLLGVMKAGMTEREVQLELDYTMLRLGSEDMAFDTIAAAGTNGSLPHAVPSDHVIAEGEMLTLDFGAQYAGYKADMTRTVAFGRISDQLSDIYHTVLDAQLASLAAIAPGKQGRDIDKVARDLIDKKYPGAFGHSLGHGVGLDIHEQPGLNTREERALTPGHIVTVEPGVYIPGVGGCRIEDTVVITDTGYDNLITAPKQLITL